MQKYIDEKCLCCSSFSCFLTLHAGTVGIHKFLGFLIMLVFQSRISNYLYEVNARNSLKSQAVSSDSESEVEPFIIQTKAALVAVLQLSFRKTILNLHLRVQTTGKRLTIPLFAPRIFRPTCLFTDKEDSGGGITTGTDKEIQSRNEARIPQNTKRSTNMSSWSTRVRDDWLKNGTLYHDSDTFVDP